jgi:uncharacterized membrane protein YheB (UPF0754 family)
MPSHSTNIIWIAIYLPIVGAIIGWVCKLVGIRMLWYPEKFVGIGPIGWQGVIQRRAPKFAAGVADTVIQTGVNVDQILSRVDPDELATVFGPTLDKMAPDVVRQIADTVRPGLWEGLAESAREMILAHFKNESRRIVGTLVTSLKPVVAEALDVRSIVIERLTGANSNRLALLLQTVGARELRWVIYYGAILGFIIGGASVFGYTWVDRWWVLPIAGAFDGVVNNWLAIQMIFRPLKRTRYLGIFPYQGLFPARQEEISQAYADMMAKEVVAPGAILAYVMQKDGTRILSAALETLEREVESQVATISMFAGVEVSAGAHRHAMSVLVETMQAAIPVVLPDVERYLEKRLAVAEIIERQLAIMPKEAFERILRGIFEEDEKTVIAIGGLLGGAIGLVQAGVMLLF